MKIGQVEVAFLAAQSGLVCKKTRIETGYTTLDALIGLTDPRIVVDTLSSSVK